MHDRADLKIAEIVHCIVYELEFSETALVHFGEPIRWRGALSVRHGLGASTE
jgi:hypothetical protein